MHSVSNRVIKNSGILYARMVITVLISLYSTRLIINALGVTDYGIFNLVASTITMLTFLNNAMAGASQRFISFSEGAGNINQTKVIFNVSIVLHLIIAFIVFTVFETAGFYLFEDVLEIPVDKLHTAKVVYQFMIVSTLFTIISVPYDAVINAHENMLFVAITGVIEALLKLGTALYINHTHYDKLYMYGLFSASSAVILLIINRIYCRLKYIECEINLKKYYDANILKRMTSFAGWSFLGVSSNIMVNYGQGIVMNTFFGPIVNTAQAITNQISGLSGTLATTMLKAVNPIIAKSEGAGNRALMINASTISSKITTFLLIVFYIPIIIEVPYILKIWLEEFPTYTIIFCRLLLIRFFIEQMFLTLYSNIYAVGNIKNYQIYNFFVNILIVIAVYTLFLSGFPAYFFYVIFIICAILNSCYILFYSKIVYNLDINQYLNDVVLRCVLCFLFPLCVAMVPNLLLPQSYIRLSLVLLISTFTFFICVWFIGLNAKEKELVNTLLNKCLNK